MSGYTTEIKGISLSQYKLATGIIHAEEKGVLVVLHKSFPFDVCKTEQARNIRAD